MCTVRIVFFVAYSSYAAYVYGQGEERNQRQDQYGRNSTTSRRLKGVAGTTDHCSTAPVNKISLDFSTHSSKNFGGVITTIPVSSWTQQAVDIHHGLTFSSSFTSSDEKAIHELSVPFEPDSRAQPSVSYLTVGYLKSSLNVGAVRIYVCDQHVATIDSFAEGLSESLVPDLYSARIPNHVVDKCDSSNNVVTLKHIQLQEKAGSAGEKARTSAQNFRLRSLHLCSNPMKTIWSTVESFNVKQNDCNAKNGLPVCCSSLEIEKQKDHLKQVLSSSENKDSLVNCKVKKVYVPSEHEELHLARSKDLKDRTSLLAFLTSQSETDANSIWLQRIRLRMTSSDEVPETAEDLKYISRFEMTRECSDGNSTFWREWIEPLTIHARNPNSYLSCGKRWYPRTATNSHIKAVAIQNSDHILIQSGHNLRRQGRGRNVNAYAFDAGSSYKFCVVLFNIMHPCRLFSSLPRFLPVVCLRVLAIR